MAKQGLFGKYRGKLGDSVGYKIANAKKAGTIGTRQYVAEIANPKTQAQATQRMRMKPAINFYRGLASLLDHSWQGVKYGARSRARFMQLALSPTLTGFPYVDKGEERFIPGEYPVSIGSVPFTCSLRFGNNGYFEGTGIFSDTTAADWEKTSWGDFSKEVLMRNSMLQDGDEVTIIWVSLVNGFYIPGHRYFVLDTTSLATCYDIFSGAGIAIIDDGTCYPLPTMPTNEEGNVFGNAGLIVAGAIIVSRHPAKNSDTWLRSTSYMQVADSVKSEWMTEERLLTAKATYMDTAVDLTSDWLLNQSQNNTDNASLNPSTKYAVSMQTTSIGDVNKPMAVLSVDGATAKPIVMSKNNTLYYGTLSSKVITFSSANKIGGTPAADAFYTAAAAQAVLTDYTFVDDVPNIE